MKHRVKGVGLWLGLAALAFSLLVGGRAMAYDFEKAIPEEYRISGFALSCQAYSFNRYSFFEAVDKTKSVGCRLIEAYPGQKLKPDGDATFSHDAPKAVWDEAKAKLDKEGIKLVAYGVVGLGNDEAANRKVFDFCKYMGVLVINSEPPIEAIPGIAKLAKEYDIPVGMHNHPKRPDDANYKHWSPDFVLECVNSASGVKGWVGSGADTGHWMRSDLVPLDCLKKLQGNIISMHIKDLNQFGRPGEHDVPFGTGKVQMTKVLDELKRQGYKGVMSIEYEYNWTTSVPEIAQCVGFVRGYGAAINK